MKTEISVMFTQMQAKVGFKIFREKAVATMIKELKQLKNGLMPGKQVIQEVYPDILSREEKQRALKSINLIQLYYLDTSNNIIEYNTFVIRMKLLMVFSLRTLLMHCTQKLYIQFDCQNCDMRPLQMTKKY